MSEKHIGIVDHYYPRAHAATVDLEDGGLKVGDQIHIVGHGTDLTETVKTIEIEHEPIQRARKGQVVGVGVDGPVHKHADVYLIE